MVFSCTVYSTVYSIVFILISLQPLLSTVFLHSQSLSQATLLSSSICSALLSVSNSSILDSSACLPPLWRSELHFLPDVWYHRLSPAHLLITLCSTNLLTNHLQTPNPTRPCSCPSLEMLRILVWAVACAVMELSVHYILTAVFSLLSSLSPPGYFSPRSGYRRVFKLCMGF